MENYTNLTDAIADLKSKGYTEDFNLRQNCIECRNGEYQLLSNEFHIDKVFRFDVNTDPGDQSILYAISSDVYPLKGILVNGYGIYTEELTTEMLRKLSY